MAASLREQVLTTIEAMHACRDQDEACAVSRLMGQGTSEIDARVLLDFVGLALGRAVISRMPATTSIRLSETVHIRNSKNQGPLRSTCSPAFPLESVGCDCCREDKLAQKSKWARSAPRPIFPVLFSVREKRNVYWR